MNLFQWIFSDTQFLHETTFSPIICESDANDGIGEIIYQCRLKITSLPNGNDSNTYIYSQLHMIDILFFVFYFKESDVSLPFSLFINWPQTADCHKMWVIEYDNKKIWIEQRTIMTTKLWVHPKLTSIITSIYCKYES